jgi:predicted DNA-binding transcriptional regulator YafY
VSNTHRIAWIDGQIRSGRHPNATTIARRFEISRRQAARDLEYLRYSLGAPLLFVRERNGYTYAEEGFTLPTLLLSETERSALAYLAEQYRTLPGDPAAGLASVLIRITGQVVVDRPSELAPPVAGVDARELRAVQALEWAIEHRRKAIVRFRGYDGVVVPRTVSPLAIARRRGLLCCGGYYDELGLIVWLPIGRFESVDATDEPFDPPPHFYIDDDRATMYPDPFVAIVRLSDERDAERLEGATALQDGTVRIHFYDSPTVLSALLVCRSPFEVLSPDWLRSKLLDRLSDLSECNRRGS